MYWFWLFLMASQPYLLLLGLFGVFGKEAEEAANDICAGMAIEGVGIARRLFAKRQDRRLPPRVYPRAGAVRGDTG